MFGPEALKEADSLIESMSDSEDDELYSSTSYGVRLGSVDWQHDTEEEFFADIRKTPSYYTYDRRIGRYHLDVTYWPWATNVTVTAPSRAEIERVFEVFERHAASCKLPEPEESTPSPVVFVGHGRSEQWRDLKDHLHEQHGFDIEAYEIGARAGHAIRDILEHMLEKSSFAILVLTGEDKDDEGELRARQNVVHELGLFQGRLGFSRAIVLLEEGTQEFSNIHGIHQIRYGKGRIRETYGDVLAVLRREFGGESAA